MTIKNQIIINNEVVFDKSQQLLAATDLDGVITYANNIFCHVSGYSQEELLGNSHHIVHHPDMPRAAFTDLWKKLQQHQSWRGLIKNRCKDGRYYWVDTYVTPLYENDQHIGYQSVCIMPSNELKSRASALYKKINSENVFP